MQFHLSLLEKCAKRVPRCLVYGTLALELSQRFQKIQEPVGEPLQVLSIVCTGNIIKVPQSALRTFGGSCKNNKGFHMYGTSEEPF